MRSTGYLVGFCMPLSARGDVAPLGGRLFYLRPPASSDQSLVAAPVTPAALRDCPLASPQAAANRLRGDRKPRVSYYGGWNIYTPSAVENRFSEKATDKTSTLVISVPGFIDVLNRLPERIGRQ